jgi:DNA-binding MarR family transcriptional regulator
MSPNRKVNVAMNRPVNCEECQQKQCLTTGRLCQAAELWVSQDYVGQNSSEVMANGSSDYGSSMTHLDLVNFYHTDSVGRDSLTAYDAWNKLKSLRLKPKHLEILRLFYKEGKRLCECSLALGIPDQTAWARKDMAKKAVANRLKRLEYWEKIKFKKRLNIGLRRKIATLYFRELYGKKEIAEILDVTPSCIGRNLAKVIKSLG